jgi:virginiamycin B lyase
MRPLAVRSTPFGSIGCLTAMLIMGALSSNQALSQASLPNGPGRQIVEGACIGCHGVERITRAGYTREGWDNVLHMMANLGASVRPDQFPTLAAYLAKNFPEKTTPVATAVAGPVRVDFKEWSVPQPGERPHDPLAASDGAIWYTGQFANVLGVIDPNTGRIREYQIAVPDSGPHGLTEDRQGNIWFTANFKAYIGKLVPSTGAFTEYKMPDPAARDPHTLLFDNQGLLWFTVQGGNKVGRLDPASGEIRLVESPTAHSLPYGMVINSKGVPFFVEFGSNKVASIDPRTLAITEYPLPDARSRPRRIAITADDAVWYSDYSRGYLGRLDPATGRANEWPSPSGPESRPYAITALKGIVWYCETGVHPNTLVRFDPATEKFQTWTIPSGGMVVRNMMPTRNGELVLAESGANRVALVTIR